MTTALHEAPAFLAKAATPPPCISQPCLFHAPDDGRTERGNRPDQRIEAAIELCLDCPLMLACRQAGRDGREWGVWGAETEEERAAAGYPPRARAQGQPDCGTEAGAKWHRRNEPGIHCPPCVQAAADAGRLRRQNRDKSAAERWPPSPSPQERQVLELLAVGADRIGIQAQLGITGKTYNGVMSKLRQKLRTDTDGLVPTANELGLLPVVEYGRAA